MIPQNTNEVQFSLPQESGVDVKKWLFRILRLWPWIIVSLIFCIACAYIYLRSTEPVFKSVSSLIIEDPEKGQKDVLKDMNMNGSGKTVENEIIEMKSRDLMRDVVLQEQLYTLVKRKGTFSERTIYRLDLPVLIEVPNPDTILNFTQFRLFKEGNDWMVSTNPKQSSKVRFGEGYMIGNILIRFWPNKFVNGPVRPEDNNYTVYLRPIGAAVNDYIGRLQVDPYSKTASILNLSIIDNDPTKASAVLGTLMDNYSQHGLTDKNKEISNTIHFLNERLAVVEGDLRKVEGDIQSFQTRNKMVDITSQSAQFISSANQIDQQKATQITQMNMLNEAERQLTSDKTTSTVPSTLGISDPTINNLSQKLSTLILQRDDLASRAGPRNPLLVNYEDQIKSLQSSLLDNIQKLKKGYGVALNDIQSKEAQFANKISSVPEQQKELIQIKRNQSVQEQLYYFLLQRREESQIKLASSTTDTRTVEQPYGVGQIKPNNQQVIGIGIFMGLFIPIAILLLIGFFDNKVEDKKEIEKSTFAPLLGEIQYVKKMDNPIQITSKSRSVIAEQLRAIRTAISYTGKGEATKSILVTSQRSGEGKSFTSLNLAASYSQLGKKVVVLEFDLRKPRIARSLGLDPKIGISTYLSRDIILSDILIPLPEMDGNLFLLPAGPLPPNPAELILGDNMAKMMKHLNEFFDYIIIDTPPFSIITDATLLQQYADINIVVLRQGYTFKNVYQELNQRMVQFPNQPLYLILNGTGKRQEYGYTQNYGYGYGYFEDEKKKTVKA